jgi:hypothetical protein
VITNATTGNDNVKALVYVDASAPDEDEPILPLVGADSVLKVDGPTTVFDFVPHPGAPPGDVEMVITPEAQRSMADRAKATITEVKAGHLSMITHPAVVVGVIGQAVQATA